MVRRYASPFHDASHGELYVGKSRRAYTCSICKGTESAGVMSMQCETCLDMMHEYCGENGQPMRRKPLPPEGILDDDDDDPDEPDKPTPPPGKPDKPTTPPGKPDKPTPPPVIPVRPITPPVKPYVPPPRPLPYCPPTQYYYCPPRPPCYYQPRQYVYYCPPRRYYCQPRCVYPVYYYSCRRRW